MTDYKITWKQAIAINGAALLLSYIIFLMAQVFMADIIKDYIVPLYKNEEGYILILIILMFGIILVVGINFIIYAMFLKTDYGLLLTLLLFSFILTILIIMFISYLFVYYTYSHIFSEYSVIEQFFLMPSFLIFFSIYILDSPVILWNITSIIFSCIMLLLTKEFVRVKYKSKSKIKPLYKSVL